MLSDAGGGRTNKFVILWRCTCKGKRTYYNLDQSAKEIKSTIAFTRARCCGGEKGRLFGNRKGFGREKTIQNRFPLYVSKNILDRKCIDDTLETSRYEQGISG